MTYGVIMAGGIGSRFWPKSRRARPKQFLDVFGEATLIQNTAARLQGLVPPERQFAVTNERYTEQTQRQLPALPDDNILAEPVGRNTAPCIAYAATVLHARDTEAVMIVLPADHAIRDVSGFQATLRAAVRQAEEPGALVTLGIEPTYPATGYGYIQYDDHQPDDHQPDDRQPDDRQAKGDDDAPAAYPVRTFAEKPDLPTAERFLDSGDFLWNSGMFVWRADTVLNQIETHLPDIHEAFAPVAAALQAGDPPSEEMVRTAYQQCPSVSIDYGVMERASGVHVVPGRFDWSDVGDWQAVYEMRDKDDHGNALSGDTLVHDASRCLVEAGGENGEDGRFVALVGVHDLAVIDTEDAVLVCHRDSTQQVRNVVEYLHAHQLEEYV
jgi:mannose-1-phosphate guanylyltransferase